MITKLIKYKLTILLIVFSTALSFAQGQFDQTDIGIDEHLDTYLPKDIYFTNLQDERVNLTDLIDKPTVIAFVYFKCPGICSPLLDGIREVIERSEMKLGKDYQVITISFDATDTPELGREKKKNYTHSMREDIDTKHWIWLTGDSTNIYKATEATGFKFKRQGVDFIHTGAIIAISPKGKITRYLHGLYFLPFDFKMSIIEANKEKSSPSINKVLEFCFSYDPDGKKYVFNVTRIMGTIIIVLAVALFLLLILKRKKTKV
ncbi:MAG: SCO family protein [Hyphomicrobiales bacterium]